MSREVVGEIVREKQHEIRCARQQCQPKREVNDCTGSYWEVGEKDKVPKPLVGWKATLLQGENRESISGSAPLPRVVGGWCRVSVFNQRDLLKLNLGAIQDSSPRAIHNATGVLREVRVLHSSPRTGKPCTWRREGQVQTNRRAKVTR